MHGGKSTGRPVKHGFNTKEAVAERKQLNDLIREVNATIKEFVDCQTKP